MNKTVKEGEKPRSGVVVITENNELNKRNKPGQ